MSTSLTSAIRVLRFPEEMLVQIALGSPPESVVEEFGYVFEEIKNLPHYLVQYQKVEAELFQEGAITKVIAGHALHQVVEKVAIRILDDRMSQADLLKSGEFLKKVKDTGEELFKGVTKPQFTIEINFPDGTKTSIKQVNVIDHEMPILEVDDYVPEEILDAYNETKFGVEFE